MTDMLGPYRLGYVDDDNAGIYTGDARELAQAIPDESVDMVFTDPPYLREFLPLYRWLALECVRVLRPGGYLFAYGGAMFTPDILDALRVPGLDYFWVDILLHASNPKIWSRKLFSSYKPIFVFTKGQPSRLWWRFTSHKDEQDKRYHEWGQGVMTAARLIGLLTDQNMTIWEPFAGGGTTCVAARQLHRRYLAFEIDPATAACARERVRQTQPPLFVLDAPEQMGMSL